MTSFDTPVGKFEILLNGYPTEFNVVYGKPVTFRTRSGVEIISSFSYVAYIDISDLKFPDFISGRINNLNSYYSGCVSGMASIMCHSNFCTLELSTPYTEAYEDDTTQRFLPYESNSFTAQCFALRILDDPSKYNNSPIQRKILFLIAWAYTDENDAAWSSQATALL